MGKKAKEAAKIAQEAGLIVLTDEYIHELMKEAGKSASQSCIKAMEQERIRQEKKSFDNRYKTTKDMLKSYRREKIRFADEEEFTEEEKAERRWAFLEDLIGSPSGDGKLKDTIPDFERKRRESKYTIWLIENALRLYDIEVTRYGNEVDKRRFNEMKALYIDEEQIEVSELANMNHIAERIVYKDIGIAIRIMMEYLFGTP